MFAQKLFPSIVSVLCLFVAFATSLAISREGVHHVSSFNGYNIDGPEEAATLQKLSKRETITQECAAKINPDLQRCYDMSIKAAAAAKTPDNILFNEIFGELDQNYRNSVSQLFSLVAEKCNPGNPLKNKVHCDEPASMTLCSEEIAPVAYAKGHQIMLCPKFWDEKYERSVCGEDNDRASVFLHEFGHMFMFDGEALVDHAYADQKEFYDLSSEQALTNSDSYTLFARMVNDDCKYEDRLALLGIEDDSEPTST